MSEANKVQVGGDHYKTKDGVPEHWDIVTMHHLDYFQGQITKYVMRWKDKGASFDQRRENLLKAQHFLQKYLEVCIHFDTPFQPAVEVTILANGWQCEGYFGDMTQLYRCPQCHEYLRAASMGHALEQHDGNCNGALKQRSA